MEDVGESNLASMFDLEDHQMISIQSNRLQIGTNWSGDCSFTHQLNSTQYIPDVKNCSLWSNMKFTGATGRYFEIPRDGTTLAKNNFVSQMPMNALFTQGSMYVNDKLLSQITNFSAHNCHMKLLTEQKETQDESGNPYFPVTREINSLPNTTYANGLLPSNHYNGNLVNKCVIKSYSDNGTLKEYDMSATVTTNQCLYILCQFNMPIPFLYEVDEPVQIPPNSKIEVRFTMNSDFASYLIAGRSDATTTDFDFRALYLNIETARCPIPRELKISQKYIDVWSARQAFNGNLTLNVPASTRRVMISFMRSSSRKGGDYFNYTIPVKPLKTAAVELNTSSLIDNGLLNTFYITFNGNSYPRTPYNLTGSSDTNDVIRAYDNYKKFTTSFSSGEQNIIGSLAEFKYAPVFVFSTTPSPVSTGSSALTIYAGTTEGPTPADYDIAITAEYIRHLNVNYDANGVVTSTTNPLEA